MMICLLFLCWFVALLALDLASACRKPVAQPLPRRSAVLLTWEG